MMTEESMGWGEVIGVWYDLVDGRPEMEILMLPGRKRKFTTAINLTDNDYYLAFGEGDNIGARNADELAMTLRRGNIPFGLFRIDLRKGGNLEKLYVWHVKAVELHGLVNRFTLTDVDATPLRQSEVFYAFGEDEESFHRQVVNLLREKYGLSRPLPTSKNFSLEFEMLGPTYLLKL